MLAKVAELQQEQREEQELLQQQREEEEQRRRDATPKIHSGFKNAYISVNRTLSGVVWSAMDMQPEVGLLVGYWSVNWSVYSSACRSADFHRKNSCCTIVGLRCRHAASFYLPVPEL